MVTAELADSLDAHARVFPAGGRVGSTDALPLSGLVDEPVAGLKLHRQDAAPCRRCRLALPLGARSRHVRSDSSLLVAPSRIRPRERPLRQRLRGMRVLPYVTLIRTGVALDGQF